MEVNNSASEKEVNDIPDPQKQNYDLPDRMRDPIQLLAACKTALPSWEAASQTSFSFSPMLDGGSNEGMYLVSCSLPQANPSCVVVRVEAEPRLSCDAIVQLGDQGLGPQVYYVEGDKQSPLCGLTVMALVEGKNLGELTMSTSMMEGAGKLIRCINDQPINALQEGGKFKNVMRELVEVMDGWGKNIFFTSKQELQNIEERFGTFPLIMLQWLGNVMRKLVGVEGYQAMEEWEREERLLLRSFTIKPLIVGKLVFLHGDPHRNNMMTSDKMLKEGTGVIAVDFESLSTGPGTVDLGTFVSKSRPFGAEGLFLDPGLGREEREAVARGFLGEKRMEEDVAKLLFDIEIGVLQRLTFLTNVSYSCRFDQLKLGDCGSRAKIMKSIRESLRDRERGLEIMETARENLEMMEEVIENGLIKIILDSKRCL